MTESFPGLEAEQQSALRERRIQVCTRLFAAYAVVDAARSNPWVSSYCETRLGVADGDSFPEAVNRMWDDPRFTYSVRGLFDLNEGAELIPEEQEMVEFVRTAAELTQARDDVCNPVVERILGRS